MNANYNHYALQDIFKNKGGNGSKTNMPKNATQFHPSDASMENLDIVIGLDFGTSCTKVVLQAPHFSGSWAYVVHFGELGHDSNKKLLPSILWVNSKGVCGLQEDAESTTFNRIKTDLLKNPDTVFTDPDSHLTLKLTPRVLAIAYIACVLQEVRHWFIMTQAAIFSNYKIRWHLNLGIPSTGYNDATIIELFREIAQIAWYISTFPGRVRIHGIESVFGRKDFQDRMNGDISMDDINVIPEVASEVVGYARSHLFDPGLHVIVDVGARTLDIASFELFKREGEHNYSILTADLDNLGTNICCYNHFKIFARELIQKAIEYNRNPMSPVPESVSLDFVTNETLKNNPSYQDFYKSCRKIIARTLKDLKMIRDPNSERWQTGLPVFLCGGGKDIAIYRRVVDECHDWISYNMNIKGLDIRQLPKPENLQAIDLKDEDYHRFAVAYGLSFPKYNIGIIKAPEEIIDIEKPVPHDFTKNFIEKEYT